MLITIEICDDGEGRADLTVKFDPTLTYENRNTPAVKIAYQMLKADLTMRPLEDFVRESNQIEGILRDPLPSEIAAHEKLLSFDVVTVSALEEFVATVQPGAVLRRESWQNVQVGNHIAPQGGRGIELSLEIILARAAGRGGYKTHLAYEALHPFMDGNGRSGRALWLWQMGGEAPIGFLHRFYYQTLDDPR